MDVQLSKKRELDTTLASRTIFRSLTLGIVGETVNVLNLLSVLCIFLAFCRAKTALIVKNLIQLTQGASIGDLTSLEELVGLITIIFLARIFPETQRGASNFMCTNNNM